MITETKEVHRSAKTKRRKFLFTLWTSHRRTFNHQRNRTNLSRGDCQLKRKSHRKTTITSTTTMYKRISLNIQTAASLLFCRIQVLHVSDDSLNEPVGISSHRVTCEREAIMCARQREMQNEFYCIYWQSVDRRQRRVIDGATMMAMSIDPRDIVWESSTWSRRSNRSMFLNRWSIQLSVRDVWDCSFGRRPNNDIPDNWERTNTVISHWSWECYCLWR